MNRSSKRRYLLVAAVLFAGLFPRLSAVAETGCTAERGFRYETNSATVTYWVNLPKCWPKKASHPYRLEIWLGRYLGDGSLVRVHQDDKEHQSECAITKVCRARVTLPHPEVEVAYYLMEAQYKSKPDLIHHQTFFLRCVSTNVFRECSTLVPLPTPTPSA